MLIRIAILFTLTALAPSAGAAQDTPETSGFGLHMGIRVGEVTATSAVVWTRVCAGPRSTSGPETPPRKNWDGDPRSLNGYVPGAPGRVTFHIARLMESGFELTPIDVTAESDFVAKATVTGLKPGDLYFVIATATSPNGETAKAQAGFRTATSPETPSRVNFAVVTGQEYDDRDAGDDGFLAYRAMLEDDLKFLVYTGDSVYYDRPTFLANSHAKMRHFWTRIFSLPHTVKLFETVPTYFEVDDHDLVDNDCWPGGKSRIAPMTMVDGVKILKEQTPIGDQAYRSIRWGKDLEVWLLEGRLFRSANPEPDSDSKTIWGQAQRDWLEESLLLSDATFRVIVSPTPIIGPDRSRKNDNHANAGFATEGRWIKSLLSSRDLKNTIICCGDRHWQYHSVDPEFDVHEFSCGPLSDKHAGGAPNDQPDWQVFRRVQGGYLTVGVARPHGIPTLTAQHRSVTGEVVHEWKATADD